MVHKNVGFSKAIEKKKGVTELNWNGEFRLNYFKAYKLEAAKRSPSRRTLHLNLKRRRADFSGRGVTWGTVTKHRAGAYLTVEEDKVCQSIF